MLMNDIKIGSCVRIKELADQEDGVFEDDIGYVTEAKDAKSILISRMDRREENLYSFSFVDNRFIVDAEQIEPAEMELVCEDILQSLYKRKLNINPYADVA